MAILLALATLAGLPPAKLSDLPQLRVTAQATASVRLVTPTQIRGGVNTSPPDQYQQRTTTLASVSGTRPAVLFEFY